MNEPNGTPQCSTTLTTGQGRPTRRSTGGVTLHELGAEWIAIGDALEESGGELTELVEHRLAQLDGSITNKTQGIICLVRQFEADAAVAEAEAIRLRDLANERTNRAKSLKAYLLREMSAMDRKKIETPLGNVTICKNSRPSIRWVGLVIPEEYQRVKVELDGTKAYEDWKTFGELPEGFEVVTGEHLRLK